MADGWVEGKNLFETEEENRGYLARKVGLSEEQIERLEMVNRELHRAVKKSPPDIVRFLDANRIFHEIITEAAQSPRLGQVLAMLVEQPVVLRTARSYSIEDLKQSARDHDELIAAFRAGDPGWARAVMGSHLRRAFHTFADAAEAAE